ncbi:MAG: hypothetical protein ABF876_07115 [Acetobacter aceti]|nr:hypothetical protein [Acetobacter aceti]
MPDLFTYWWFWLGTALSSLASPFGLAVAMLRAKRWCDPFG